MTERIVNPERNHNTRPELIRYDDGEYAFILDAPSTEINFDAAARGSLDPESVSFDTTGHLDTMVALDCRDYDGNQSIFVAGSAYGDLVCKLDVNDSKVSYTLFEDSAFNAMLAAAPMTIGARHDRLGGRKLTKAYALPQMAVNDNETSKVRRAQEGVSSPLGIANRLFQERLNRQPK